MTMIATATHSRTEPFVTESSMDLQTDQQRDSLLARYFHEVSHCPSPRPEQEFEMARALEALEVDAWRRVLEAPRLLLPVLQLVAARVEQLPEPVRALKRARREVLAQPSDTSARRYAEGCAEVARALRAIDVDRELFDEVLDHLARHASGDDGTIFATGGLDFDRAEVGALLERAAAAGRAAQRKRDEFVRANLRLVVTIARKFNFGQVPFNDLIQEGNIGLIKAVGRFDHRRGYRFSTYASWWIRHAVTRAIADKGRLVRVPVHMLATVRKVARASTDLAGRLGREPTEVELSQETALPVEDVRRIHGHLPRQNASLDNSLSDEDGRRFVDMLEDEDHVSATDIVGDQQVIGQVREIIGELKPMETDVLRKRFGLDGREHTLVEIGADYNLSRERIRQIQEQALGKIRRALMRRKAV
jgi:RNA polymerase primary sigma factor